VVRLSDFKGIHHGEAMVVCGLGNSVRHVGDPHRFRTIGVNDIERAFTPTYMFCMDAPKSFSPERLRYVQHSRARYIFTDHDLGIKGENIVRFPIRRRETPYLDDANALYFTGRPITSPYIALSLAAHMGAKAIGLIGVDFTLGHFFAADGNHKLTNMLPGIDKRFYDLGLEMLERGVKVFNLSAESRLRAFPRLTPDEFYELQRRGRMRSWTRPAKRIYFYSFPAAGKSVIALARLINTETPNCCRLSAPDSPDVIPGSMPEVEQNIADDSHADLDCETAPLPQGISSRADFGDMWNYQVRPLLFSSVGSRTGHSRALSMSMIVSQERASAEELTQTVASLWPALSNADEIVVIPSRGGKGRMPEWLSGIAPIHYLDPLPGESFVAARNRAAKASRGDLLVFTDANVQAPSYWPELLVDAFRKTDAAAVGPAIADMYQPNLRSYGMHFADAELSTMALRRLQVTPYAVPLLPNTFLAVRHDAMRCVGGFDGSMRASGADDLEFCLRLWTSGYECYLASELEVAWMNPFAAGAIRTRDYWQDLLHNLLRLATVHFSPQRLSAFVASASVHAEYPAAAAGLQEGELAERRNHVLALRQHSDDWFFDRFRN
jgi:Glycosyl transferase family 2